VVALVKPQFEAGRGQVGRGGVVRDPAVHAAVLRDLLAWAAAHGFAVRGLTASPLRGPAGNVEFLAHLVRREHDVGIEAGSATDGDEALIAAALAEAAG
jgi:23S rRNA (cytidine1920-2'-O)/16S rRNA (cytidine1409-2'-O)-methyltransferase